MHLRRALLLFAIVLGLAALAASVSRPEQSADDAPARPRTAGPTEPTAGPGGSGPPSRTLTFEVARPRTEQVDARTPLTVLVEVGSPGVVEIPGLGLSAVANPLTPARFELLPDDAGRQPILFTPAASDASAPAGAILVTAGGS